MIGDEAESQCRPPALPRFPLNRYTFPGGARGGAFGLTRLPAFLRFSFVIPPSSFSYSSFARERGDS